MADPVYLQVAFAIPANKSFLYRYEGTSDCGVGYRVQAKFRNRDLSGYIVERLEEKPAVDFDIKSIDRVIDSEPVFNPELLELAEWMSRMYLCSLGEALSIMLPGAKRESRLYGDVVADIDPPRTLELGGDQQSAVDGIVETDGGMYYVYGVTGSGKTEVFLRIAEVTIRAGRGVIYLVPEIALTHQLLGHLRARFGDTVGVIHSRLTPSQRFREWRRIARGEAGFVVGARSAVFTPVKDLGLIVVDEEHEGSYKSGSTPRYHARQVAMKRSIMTGARLIMGSATPSVEAFHLSREGRIKSFELSERIAGGAMPKISVIDMSKESGTLSRALVERITETHAGGKQTILFLNRRGFSYFFHCRSCGYEMRCRQCSVTLTYHKNRNRMLCHYCGYSTAPIDTCPSCGSLDVGYSGFGTERIEQDIAQTFPDYTIRRLDTDSVRKKGALEETLEEFRSGKVDILLGTQMVAKGLNFPGVNLVGIVLADTGLQLPDFRSEERTFSLIVQVSGRAGRFAPNGEVIIQTFHPDNPAIRLAAAGDIESFYRRELEVRRELSFPPYSRLIRLVFRGKNRRAVVETAEAFAESYPQTDSELLGPAECPLAVIAGNYRFQLIARSGSLSGARREVSTALSHTRISSNVYVEIDVDPVSLL